jgi:hypothetical protein
MEIIERASGKCLINAAGQVVFQKEIVHEAVRYSEKIFGPDQSIGEASKDPLR